MPLYEYRCSDCETKFEKLIRGISTNPDGVACPDCGSETRRLVSACAAVSRGEGGQVTSVAGGGGCAGCGGSCASCGHH